MRRIKLVLAAVGVMAAISAASAVPAMANTNDHFFNNDGRFVTNNDGRFFDNGNNNSIFFNDGINNDLFPFFGFPGFGAFDNINGINTFDNVNGFDGINNGVFQEAE